jgi:hypothetical protein
VAIARGGPAFFSFTIFFSVKNERLFHDVRIR